MSLEELGQNALAFVHQHRDWAAPVVFLFAFCESVAFLSLMVPATIILLGLGVLIGENGLDFWTVWIAAAAGAICGDWLSYWLGKKFSTRVGDIWPLTRFPASCRRASASSRSTGCRASSSAAFSGPCGRPAVDAGICAMPILHFQAANVASAFVWSGAMLAPGAIGAHFLTRFL